MFLANVYKIIEKFYVPNVMDQSLKELLKEFVNFNAISFMKIVKMIILNIIVKASNFVKQIHYFAQNYPIFIKNLINFVKKLNFLFKMKIVII